MPRQFWTCAGEKKFNSLLFFHYKLMSRQFWTSAGEQNLFLCSSFTTYWWPDSSEHVHGNRIYLFALPSLHIDVQTFLNNCWGTEFILLLFLHYIMMTRQFWTCARDLELNSLLFLLYILMTGQLWTCAGEQKFNPLLFLHYTLISRQFWTCSGEQKFNPLLFLQYTLISRQFWTCAGEQKFNPCFFLHYTLISRQFWTFVGNRNLILYSSFTTHWYPDSS